MDELYDRIDLYILGKMSPEDISQFERDMTSDAQLKENVEIRKLLRNGIMAIDAEESYWQDMSERIDDYMMRRMSDEEMTAFEAQLSWDPELRDRLETQRLIMNGIRTQKAEKEMRGIEISERLNELRDQEQHTKNVAYVSILADEASEPAAAMPKPQRRKFKILYRVIAAAACLFIAYIPVGHYFASGLGDSAFSTTDRSNDMIAQYVDSKDYDKAIDLLQNELTRISEQPQNTPGIQSDKERTIYELASVLLLNGEVSKAKTVLNEYRQTRVPSEIGEKIIELRNKLFWIIW